MATDPVMFWMSHYKQTEGCYNKNCSDSQPEWLITGGFNCWSIRNVCLIYVSLLSCIVLLHLPWQWWPSVAMTVVSKGCHDNGDWVLPWQWWVRIAMAVVTMRIGEELPYYNNVVEIVQYVHQLHSFWEVSGCVFSLFNSLHVFIHSKPTVLNIGRFISNVFLRLIKICLQYVKLYLKLYCLSNIVLGINNFITTEMSGLW